MVSLVAFVIAKFCICRGWEFDPGARWSMYTEAAVCQLLRKHPSSYHSQEPEQVLAEPQPE